ncbi:hypothetical protein SAMN04487906_0664 [Zhouia amylolytica]|uniref:Uncharacterized protein n=1 Tax=Zhouia amylolytica TaxID=376730 RepID=A0A1I6QI10_9FLAO|nr:hypothetical protein SAMN04487906_0664 [Zhouia amylolytica]
MYFIVRKIPFFDEMHSFQQVINNYTHILNAKIFSESKKKN